MGTIDTLRRSGAQVTVASVMERLQITASRGVKFVADKLVVNAFTRNLRRHCAAWPGMPGAEHLRDSEELIQMLKQQDQEGQFTRQSVLLR